MRPVRTPATSCPCCRQLLDAATPFDATRAPQPGDLTVCLYCGMALTFTATMQLRALTDDDVRALLDVERADLARAQSWCSQRGGARVAH